jgi:hypothetical protein
MLDPAPRRTQRQRPSDLYGSHMAQHGLKGVVCVERAGVEPGAVGRVADGGCVCGLLLVSGLVLVLVLVLFLVRMGVSMGVDMDVSAGVGVGVSVGGGGGDSGSGSVVGEGSAVGSGVAEAAQVEADQLGDAPVPAGEQVVLVAPELGAEAEVLASWWTTR